MSTYPKIVNLMRNTLYIAIKSQKKSVENFFQVVYSSGSQHLEGDNLQSRITQI